jgi:hypothetical protein
MSKVVSEKKSNGPRSKEMRLFWTFVAFNTMERVSVLLPFNPTKESYHVSGLIYG